MSNAATTREIVARRFGTAHDKPCHQPTIVTCAIWECQLAGCCRYDDAWLEKYEKAREERESME